MKKQIKRIGIIQCGKLLALMYLLFGVIFIPFFLLPTLINPDAPTIGVAIGMAIAIPLLYAVGGFIGGVIGAAFYNFCASKIGGIEIELEDKA